MRIYPHQIYTGLRYALENARNEHRPPAVYINDTDFHIIEDEHKKFRELREVLQRIDVKGAKIQTLRNRIEEMSNIVRSINE